MRRMRVSTRRAAMRTPRSRLGGLATASGAPTGWRKRARAAVRTRLSLLDDPGIRAVGVAGKPPRAPVARGAVSEIGLGVDLRSAGRHIARDRVAVAPDRPPVVAVDEHAVHDELRAVVDMNVAGVPTLTSRHRRGRWILGSRLADLGGEGSGRRLVFHRRLRFFRWLRLLRQNGPCADQGHHTHRRYCPPSESRVRHPRLLLCVWEAFTSLVEPLAVIDDAGSSLPDPLFVKTRALTHSKKERTDGDRASVMPGGRRASRAA